MTSPRRRMAWTALGAAAVLALFIRLGLAVQLDGRHLVEFTEASSRPTMIHATPPARRLETRLESLPCFECHSLERYQRGEQFAHEDHAEQTGHCHQCHAFTGHFQAITRRAACEECH